jgi:hypothetical protein
LIEELVLKREVGRQQLGPTRRFSVSWEHKQRCAVAKFRRVDPVGVSAFNFQARLACKYIVKGGHAFLCDIQ